MPDCVQGFRKRKSIVTNAEKHCGKELVVTADISDFFGAVPFQAVLEVFQAEVPCQQVALMLARLCTLNGELPQGGRTSPAIANLVTGPMDDDIKSHWPQCDYSRYADDLTLSGAVVPSKLALERLLVRHGYSLKAGSFHTQTLKGGQFVTGLCVSSGKKPRIPRRVRREIERDLNFSERFGIGGHLENRGESGDGESVAQFRLRLESRIHSWGRAEELQRDQWIDRFSRLADRRETSESVA